jgi:general secretion pathway protein K
VLWLVAALSAIAFTVASTVRSEVGRVSNATDGLKSYYLATGAIDRALLYMQWQGYKTPDGSPLYYGGGPWMRLEFPGGLAVVNVIPESSKLNVNFEPPEELYNLAMALGAGPERARAIALGIVEYRTPLIETPLSPLSGSSFGPRHASFEEIEELLLVNGMTPELFYGTYESDAQGALVRRHGFVDCLSIYATGVLDVNTVDPAVMAAVGVPPDTVAAILQMRTQWPIGPDRFAALAQGAPGVMRLGIANGSVYTIRATAQGRLPDGTLSDARRSVAAMVKLLDRTEFREPYHVLRWYDNVWVQ